MLFGSGESSTKSENWLEGASAMEFMFIGTVMVLCSVKPKEITWPGVAVAGKLSNGEEIGKQAMGSRTCNTEGEEDIVRSLKPFEYMSATVDAGGSACVWAGAKQSSPSMLARMS